MYCGALMTEWVAGGFETPESAAQECTKERYIYVSNMPGGPRGTGGYLSLLSETGRVIRRKAITGLNAPKGIEITPCHDLLVCDLNTVRVYSVLSGKKLVDIPIPGSRFLNGIAWDWGERYFASDTETNRIYVFGKDAVPKVYAEIQSPNGLFYDRRRRLLYVALWEPGGIGILDERKRLRTIRGGFRNLDGIAVLKNGWILTSDFASGEIRLAKPGGRPAAIISGLANPADINLSIDGELLLVPEFGANQVRAFLVAAPSAGRPTG